MSAKTYNPVQSNFKFIDLIEHIHQQTGPVTATQISRALGMPHATVMSHLITAVERKWVKQTGDLYEPGLRIVGMYSAYKMGLVNKIEALQRELNTLEA
jgi:DNA-binding IclR family transcriptional regulator